MALWYCTGCGAAYAVGLPRCPQCQATEHEENPVPKISKASGVTFEPSADPATEPAASAEVPAAAAEAAPEPPAAKAGPVTGPPPRRTPKSGT